MQSRLDSPALLWSLRARPSPGSRLIGLAGHPVRWAPGEVRAPIGVCRQDPEEFTASATERNRRGSRSRVIRP